MKRFQGLIALLTLCACGTSPIEGNRPIDLNEGEDSGTDAGQLDSDISVGEEVDVEDDATNDAEEDTNTGTETICDAGESYCEGNALIRCSDDGTQLAQSRCQGETPVCFELSDTEAICAAEGEPTDPACDLGESYCDGDTLLSCNDTQSGFSETPCEFGCDPSIPACEGEEPTEPLCDPGERLCDGDELLICAPSGERYNRTFCENGCDDTTERCLPDSNEACDFDLDSVDLNSSVFVNLCGTGNNFNNVNSEDCSVSGSDANDVMYSITIEERQTILFTLFDNDDSAPIDTRLYLRSSCDTPDSQIACSDDIPCEDGFDGLGPCSNGGLQLRQSEFEVTLNPGTYYIILDSFQYGSSGTQWTCGNVGLYIEEI